MSNMKKLVTGISAVVIGVSGAIGAGALEWKVCGYDTSVLEQIAHNTYRVGVVYEQYDDNGLTTGVVVDKTNAELYGLEPYAKVSLSAPMFEKAWPNREYVSVYAGGVDTGKDVYNGVKENLTYREANYMWELAAPHRIYSRTQALIYGSWYTDASYPTEYAGDVATVKAEYNSYYGFGYWKDNGTTITYMPYTLQNYAPALDTSIYFEGGIAHGALAPNAVTDLTGKKDIEIKKSFNLVLAGPKFNFDGTVSAGNEFAAVYNSADVSAETLANYGVAELVKHVYSYDGACALMDTEWVYAGFEYEAPYRYYQILKVGDVLLDGSNVAPGINRPYVYRYIVSPDGTFATANVSASYTSALSSETPFRWNEKADRFEFLVDITETLYHNGTAFRKNVYKAEPSNVFGQIRYTETWQNGQKVVTGILEGKALTGDKVYRVNFTGDIHNTVDWGNLSFSIVNAGLDYSLPLIDNMIVPAID